MTSAALLLLAAVLTAPPTADPRWGTPPAPPVEKDVTVIGLEIRHDGRVISSPTLHAEIGSDAGLRQSIEVDGRPVELELEIRIERQPKQRQLTGKFVYRMADETVSVSERWRRERRVEHVVGPFTVVLDLAAP